MRFDCDDVVAGGEQGGRHEDLGRGARGRTVARRGVGSRRVAHGTCVDACTVDLGAIDIDHCAVIGQVLHGDALECLGIGDCEVRAEVGGHGARDVRLQDGRDARVAVAERGGTGGPLGVIERGLGPVLGGGAVERAVAPGGTSVQQDGVSGVNLAVGRGHVDGGGGGAVARSVDCAHEEAVVAAARDLNAGRGRGGDRSIVAQDLVGNGIGDAFPSQGDGRGRGSGRTHQRRGLGGYVVTVIVASEATVPLSARSVDVRQIEVAADPQVAVGIGRERPRTGLAPGGELEGGPMQVLAGGCVPCAHPLDLVDTRPAVRHGPVVLVLVGTVRAVAGAVNNVLGGDGAGLHVAAHAHGEGAGGARVRASVVAEQGVLGAADEDAVASGGDGLLVLAGAHGRRFEIEFEVLGGTGLGRELRGVPSTLGAVCTGEVSAGVEGTVVLTDAHSLHGAVDFGVPAAVGTTIEGHTSHIAGVDVGAAAATQVREDATQVDVAVVVVEGAHAHHATAHGVADAEVP